MSFTGSSPFWWWCRFSPPGTWTLTKPAGPIANLHASIGATLLVLALVLIVSRLAHPVSQLPNIAAWQQNLANVVHWLLAIFLIAMPLGGILTAANSGAQFYLYGAIPVPPLVAPESALGEFAETLHHLGGFALLGLVGLHIAAALYHLVRGDGVMKRMLSPR